MPVDSRHPQYEKYADQWRKCRDCIEGEETVKRAKTRYLPKIEGQDDARYAAYLQRALFFNATDRTSQALSGFLFRKQPAISPDNEKKFYDGLVLSGNFDDFLKTVVGEVIEVGRVGILCDADANGALKLVMYRAEDIINWELTGDYGDKTLNRVALREFVTYRSEEDKFVLKARRQYRVLEMRENRYEQRIYSETKNKKLVLTETIVPQKNGAFLDFIPFETINAEHEGFSVGKPILIDLVNVNLSHYRSSADLEQGRHYTALPTPVAAGFDPDQTELKIGAGVAWISDNPQAKATFLEFTGQGLKALEIAMTEKAAMMAVLGARILEPQKKAVEAADTYKIRHSGEQSILAGIAANVENGITRAVRICREWVGYADADKFQVKLNRDYAVTEANAQLVASMFAALQGAAISDETWFYNLKQWELVPPNRTLEDEKAAIEARVPGLTGD